MYEKTIAYSLTSSNVPSSIYLLYYAARSTKILGIKAQVLIPSYPKVSFPKYIQEMVPEVNEANISIDECRNAQVLMHLFLMDDVLAWHFLKTFFFVNRGCYLDLDLLLPYNGPSGYFGLQRGFALGVYFQFPGGEFQDQDRINILGNAEEELSVIRERLISRPVVLPVPEDMYLFTPLPIPPLRNRPLLDIYPNATAAFSLRRLRSGYTGPAIRVRRGGDGAEMDIGFTHGNRSVKNLPSLEESFTRIGTNYAEVAQRLGVTDLVVLSWVTRPYELRRHEILPLAKASGLSARYLVDLAGFIIDDGDLDWVKLLEFAEDGDGNVYVTIWYNQAEHYDDISNLSVGTDSLPVIVENGFLVGVLSYGKERRKLRHHKPWIRFEGGAFLAGSKNIGIAENSDRKIFMVVNLLGEVYNTLSNKYPLTHIFSVGDHRSASSYGVIFLRENLSIISVRRRFGLNVKGYHGSDLSRIEDYRKYTVIDKGKIILYFDHSKALLTNSIQADYGIDGRPNFSFQSSLWNSDGPLIVSPVYTKGAVVDRNQGSSGKSSSDVNGTFELRDLIIWGRGQNDSNWKMSDIPRQEVVKYLDVFYDVS